MKPSARLFHKIALVGRHDGHSMAEPLSRLASFLRGRGHEVVIEADTAAAMPVQGYVTVLGAELGRKVDLAIVVGGDGTLISIARLLAPFDIPLIGINQGRLGFLTDIALADMERTLRAMLSGHFREERRTLLSAELSRATEGDAATLALNDVVINRGTLGGMIDCAVEIDGRFVYAMRADGLIVATPTGSTAYALSAQGPIVDPQVPALLLVPVAPHALTNRPIVVADEATIAVTLLRGKDAGVHCDGQSHFALQEGDRVRVSRAEHKVLLLHPEDHDYFAMLRQKLHWSETPERLRPGPSS